MLATTNNLRFRPIAGECDSKEWGIKTDDNFWTVIRVLNLEEITGDKQFLVGIYIVPVDNEAAIESALMSHCLKREDCSEEDIVIALLEDGWKETQWEAIGENYLPLLMSAYQHT